MHYPNLKNINWIRQQAMNQTVIDSTAGIAGQPRGTVRGVICDVEDPEELGRVRVIFDALNSSDIPQTEGAGAREGTGGNISHWIDTSPAFKGKQPQGLKGKRVNIAVSDGQYKYAILQDVVHDPQNLVSSAAEKLKLPNNSSMTRLPVYESGGLPPACLENHGCTLIESAGPMNSDWLCVCLRRNGNFVWVRHIDLSHGHAGGDDNIQPPDYGGDAQQPTYQQTVWDTVFPTTGKEMPKKSKYGASPTPNPYGSNAKYYDPPT